LLLQEEKGVNIFSNNVVIFKVGGLDLVVIHSVEKVLISHLFPRRVKDGCTLCFFKAVI